jgi:hypothetical protein
MIIHPLMPDIGDKSIDELIKTINDINARLRTVRSPQLAEQMQMVLAGYKDAYNKRMAEDAERMKNKSKKGEKKDG